MSSSSPQISTVPQASPVHVDSALSVISDFINLTKPRITVLLLITTCCPMVLAAHGDVSMNLLLWTLLGGALMSASASVSNCIWDRDIDRVMKRTSNRPLAAGRIPAPVASLFAAILGSAGMIVLMFRVNPEAAAVSLFGHLFYVLVYTMWLKRSTPENIVIGGAAGAVPPIVGWVAVTGTVDLDAILLFLVIFLWTPPHFWALALNKNDDYRRAGVPMLPVVAGDRITIRRMFWYAVLLLPISIWLVLANDELGLLSLTLFATLALVFILKIVRLQRIAEAGDGSQRTRAAWDVFGFSLIYLAAFFAVIVLDSTLF